MSQNPLIGISVGSIKHPVSDAPFLAVRPAYPYAVSIAGGAPVLIPFPLDQANLRALFERLDGIILSGGGDMDPAHYSAERSLYTHNITPERDAQELLLARWAVEDDKPLLAICRGHQVLNVALGGSLIQDIRDEIQTALRHDAPNDDWFSMLVHDVNVTAGSKLHTALGGETRLRVNSLHHQAVGRVAPELEVVACAEDGIIEGIEHSDGRFIIGVQWHPEALVDSHTPMKRLFEALVSASSA